MSRRARLSAILPLLLLGAVAGCTLVGGGSETIDLRFDWPAGLTAFVQTERSTRASGPRGPISATVRMSYRIDVEEVPDGRLIRRGEVRAEDPADGRSYPLDELPQPLASQLSALFPSFVVSGEGQLLRLEGTGPLIEEAERRLMSRRAELPPESAEARALAAASLSEEGLLSAAGEHWEQLVGAWSGASLTVGETYRREDWLVVRSLGGMRLRSTAEFGIRQRIPCSEETAAADCVEIEVRTRPLPEALARFEQAMRQSSAATTPDRLGALGNLEIEESSYLVAEPDTLVPHYLETTSKLRVAVPLPDATGLALDELDQHIYRFDYPAGEADAH